MTSNSWCMVADMIEDVLGQIKLSTNTCCKVDSSGEWEPELLTFVPDFSTDSFGDIEHVTLGIIFKSIKVT